MPFPFILPTTSHLTFQSHLTSSTHPSLPSTTTSHRSVLRSALKTHKRLPPSAQSTNLPTILSALQSYIPYLLALDAALSSRPVSNEDIDVTLTQELSVEWRPTLSSSTILPGQTPTRIKGHGLDYEIHSVLHTLATTHTLLARQALLGLYAATTPSAATRLSLIQTANKHLTTANSLHLYLIQRTHSSTDSPPTFPPSAIDIAPSVQSALASLSHAETVLLFVLKDDPYPALLVQSRNKNDREWMIHAPTIPKVRVGLLARLCLSAAQRAATAAAGLKAAGKGVDGELVRYSEDLRRVGRAKACRFLGIECDMEGRTGEGIAWLRGGLVECGVEIEGTAGGQKGAAAGLGSSLGRLKGAWSEKREDRRLEKGRADWGLDAGKGEEGRVLEWLERKWTKMNDTVNVQLVPDWRDKVAQMPSGRDPLTTRPWVPTVLEEDEVGRMRAPPDEAGAGNGGRGGGDESSGDDEAAGQADAVVGAFPGTKNEYRARGGDDSYY